MEPLGQAVQAVVAQEPVITQLAQQDRLILVAVGAAGVSMELFQAAQVVQVAPALSFSSGLSHYRLQVPLHLQEHG